MTWKRCLSSISSSAYVLLLTLGAVHYADDENYWLAAVMLTFAFVGPLLFDDRPAGEAVAVATDPTLGDSSRVPSPHKDPTSASH